MRLKAQTLLFVPVLLLALAAFWPGLSGPFFFDDMLHLPRIGAHGGEIKTWDEVLEFCLPNFGGSGRPLAMLSFLANDTVWPSDPRAFKYTNLLLHLLNGVLVFAFVRTLTRLINANAIGSPERRRPDPDWVALIAMALWLVHPVHLSPTMMVVQRMTLLGGTFTLLALLAYLRGRRLGAERPVAAYLWLTFGFGSAVTLGILSKETAIVSVIYVMVMEATVLAPDHPPRPPHWRLWSTVFLLLPLIALLAYLFSIMVDMGQAYQNRDFTLGERLLTEGRVLMDYLRIILLPSLSQTGPFRDDYLISRGLLSPPSTLLAWSAILGLVGMAVWRRRRWSIAALAILWFFGGQLLESTVLPLEIYFEHRNYLPMLGFFIAIAYGTMRLERSYRRLVAAGLLIFLALEAGVTYSSAGVWGNHGRLAVLWSAEHPASPRAQVMAIQYWAERADGTRLKQQLENAIANNPGNAGFQLYRLVIDRCRSEKALRMGGRIEDLDTLVPHASFESSSIELLTWLNDDPKSAGCRFSYEEIVHLAELYLANPSYSLRADNRANLYIVLAKQHRSHGDLDRTLSALDQVYAAYPFYQIPLDQALYLASAGLYQEAEEYIKRAAATPPASLYQRLTQERAIKKFAAALKNTYGDTCTAPKGNPEPPGTPPAPQSPAP